MDLGRCPRSSPTTSAQLGGGRSDVVTTINSIDATVDQTVAFFSYGLGDRVDLSLAVPFVTVDLAVARMPRSSGSGPREPGHPLLRGRLGALGTQKRFSRSGHASGIGDLVLRLKGTALKHESASVALGVDLRLPTGDKENFLGLGAAGVKPFAVLSISQGRFVPHLNVAYLWNGKSVLAGNVATGQKEDLPDQLSYAWVRTSASRRS